MQTEQCFIAEVRGVNANAFRAGVGNHAPNTALTAAIAAKQRDSERDRAPNQLASLALLKLACEIANKQAGVAVVEHLACDRFSCPNTDLPAQSGGTSCVSAAFLAVGCHVSPVDKD